jgi:transketolase
VYYRLGKDDKTTVPGLRGEFTADHVQMAREGDGVAFVAMGAVAAEAVAAATALADHGIRCAVAVLAQVHPAPVEDLKRMLSRFRVVFTVEAHYVNGGLGSVVSEVVAEGGLSCRVVRCGVRSSPTSLGGSQAYLHRVNGLSSEALVDTVLSHTAGQTRHRELFSAPLVPRSAG